VRLLLTSRPRSRSIFFVKLILVSSSSKEWQICWLHRDVYDAIDFEIVEQKRHGKVTARSVFTALVEGAVIPPNEADNPLWLRVIKYRLTCVNATKNAEQ
jgi:hypothetical protein